MDLSKYLKLKPEIDADVEVARQEVEDAQSKYLLAKAFWDGAVNRYNDLSTVKALIDALEVKGH